MNEWIVSIRHKLHPIREIWDDFRLFLLTVCGYVPSHGFRRMVYLAFGLHIGRTSSIHWRARFFRPEGVRIGDYTTIGNDAFLDGREGLSIGNCVNIAAEVRIYTREHDIDDPMFREVGGAIVIEDYAYIGSRVTVLPGVHIGYGAVVGSGAVVTKNVEPFTLVGGVPAKPIRRRNENLEYKLGYAKRFQ